MSRPTLEGLCPHTYRGPMGIYYMHREYGPPNPHPTYRSYIQVKNFKKIKYFSFDGPL